MIEKPKSITKQVVHLIQERIESGEYPPNSQIPSENKLAEQLDVSRSSIRSAMATLATRGLIIRKHGFGTYVTPRIPDLYANLTEGWELSKRIKASGQNPKIVVLNITKRETTKEEANKLEISTGDEIIVYRRLISADNEPRLLSNNIVPLALARSMDVDEEDEIALQSFLSDYCLMEFAEVLISIKPVLLDLESAKVLQIKATHPVLEFEELYFDHKHRPTTLGKNYYIGGAFRLRVVQ